MASIQPQLWPWTLSLSSAVQPLLRIMAEVLTYLNWHHQSLFPWCTLPQQLLSACLAGPQARNGRWARWHPQVGETQRQTAEAHWEKGFSDWTWWCCPNYLSWTEYGSFRNKCGMSVDVFLTLAFLCFSFSYFFSGADQIFICTLIITMLVKFWRSYHQSVCNTSSAMCLFIYMAHTFCQKCFTIKWIRYLKLKQIIFKLGAI